MYARRDVLRTAAAGTALSAGTLLSTSNAAAEGAPFGNGVNVQPAYYCDGKQALGWDLMDQYDAIESVRIEIEPPAWGEADPGMEIADAKRWIDEAAQRGYDVVATCHHWPYNGSPDPEHLQEAADWWVEHYDALAADAEITINLMNEWGNHDVTVDEYASAYNEAIGTIREGTDYTGSIVIDVPGWGQNHHVAADAAPQLEDDDLIISAHVYGDGYNATVGGSIQPEHLDVLDETEYPCTIGEFGANRPGSADWEAIVDYANELGWPVVAWAWNGDGEDDPMNMADPGWIDQPCASSYTESDYFDVVYEKLEGGGDDLEAPDAPAEIEVGPAVDDGMRVTWSSVPDADEYSVFLDDEHQATTSDTTAVVEGITFGSYTVGVRAENDAGASDRTRISFSIDPETCSGTARTEILDDGSTVCDLDGDGNYRDVNGDESVSNGDVTDFFSNQHVDPWDSRTDLFDFDGNDDVGQGDVVELFHYVN